MDDHEHGMTSLLLSKSWWKEVVADLMNREERACSRRSRRQLEPSGKSREIWAAAMMTMLHWCCCPRHRADQMQSALPSVWDHTPHRRCVYHSANSAADPHHTNCAHQVDTVIWRPAASQSLYFTTSRHILPQKCPFLHKDLDRYQTRGFLDPHRSASKNVISAVSAQPEGRPTSASKLHILILPQACNLTVRFRFWYES